MINFQEIRKTLRRLINWLVISLKCWWFGCEPDYGNAMSWYNEYSCENQTPCKRCNNCDVDYADMVGDTRHNKFKEWCNYWLFRKWWPVKCSACGHRFKHDDAVDHLPF